MTTAALCAMLTAAQVSAQTAETVATDADVLGDDLTETHDPIALPEIEAAVSHGGAGDGAELREPLGAVAAGSLAGQQFGNVAATKQASGVVRDLGDMMILLHGGILERLAAMDDGEEVQAGPPAETIPASQQATLDALSEMTGEEFNLEFASWVAQSYPEMIEAWQQLGHAEGFGALADAVLPRLERQLDVAEHVVAAGGEIADMQADLARGATADQQAEIGTRTTARFASGELDIVNAAGLFMALDNPEAELEQLRQAAEFGSDRVRVVPAEDVLSATELETLDTSIAEHEAAMEPVRGAIGGNEAVRDAIEQAGASIDTVIALDVIEDGAVVYTRDR